MSEYCHQRLTDENLKDLLPLIRDAFHQAPTLEELRDRYDTRILGAWTIGFIAYHAATGEPAAYYGVFPCKVEYEGEVALAAQSGDTMTHSRHRGRGLFITLARLAYDLARESGVHFVFGFPNANSYPGFIRHLNWTHVESLRRYALTMPALPARRWMTARRPTRRLFEAWSRAALGLLRGPEAAGFPSSAIEPGFGGIHRDDAYYAYKARRGSFVMNADGARVWLRIGEAIQIGDIERVEAAALGRTIRKARRIALALGIRRVVFQTSPGTHWDRIFDGRFGAEESLPIGWLDLGGEIPPSRVRFTLGDMDIF